MTRRILLVASLAMLAAGPTARAGEPEKGHGAHPAGLKRFDHIVVIYEENHSFDNLYGTWEGVDGLAKADYGHTLQVNQQGLAWSCLLQNDVNLTSPSPLATTCTDSTTSTALLSHFPNAPFLIDPIIPPTATSCPAPGVFAAHGVLNGTGQAGGCTEDIVHRYYQEQYQLNHGRQNRYVTGSDAVGLTMGVYDTRALPIYTYLHAAGHPKYAIADHFFQAAFGGSFLNHQWLIAAQTPTFANAVNDGSPNDLHSVVDANGMPQSYPLYVSPAGASVKDQALTASCTPGPGRGPTPAGSVCGDYAVNTIQPTFQPFPPKTAMPKQLPPVKSPTIGDRLSARRVDWAWYSGGWSNADGDVGAPGWTNGTAGPCSDPNADPAGVWPNCPDKDFQFHHQPFNYYAAFDPTTAAGKANRKAHLRDEAEFLHAATATHCGLKPVSFVKPIGEENEHPGYASEKIGSDHLVKLLQAIEGGACAKSTLVVVVYDEFGGQWDHVPPPGQEGTTPGPHDEFGPGTRVPVLVLSPLLRGRFVVDPVSHDTTSILATIEHRFGLKPLSSRDARVTDLATAFRAVPVQ